MLACPDGAPENPAALRWNYVVQNGLNSGLGEFPQQATASAIENLTA